MSTVVRITGGHNRSPIDNKYIRMYVSLGAPVLQPHLEISSISMSTEGQHNKEGMVSTHGFIIIRFPRNGRIKGDLLACYVCVYI